MSDQLFVGTRKGLFTIGRNTHGGYEVTDTALLGVPVSAVLDDGRDGTVYAALDHGHFGVKMHRRDPAASGPRSLRPSTRPSPADVVDLEPLRQIPVPWASQLLWTVEAGHPDHPGVLWCRDHPGRAVPVRRPGGFVGVGPCAVGRPVPRVMVGRRIRLPRPALRAGRTPGTPRRSLVGLSSGGVWTSTDGGDSWTVAGGLRNEYMPPGQEFDPVGPGPASHRSVRERAGRRVVSAPQRHVPLNRRRRDIQ